MAKKVVHGINLLFIFNERRLNEQFNKAKVIFTVPKCQFREEMYNQFQDLLIECIWTNCLQFSIIL